MWAAGSRPVTSSIADDTTVIRDPVTLRAERRFPVAAAVAALSPVSELIAFAARDGSSVCSTSLRAGYAPPRDATTPRDGDGLQPGRAPAGDRGPR